MITAQPPPDGRSTSTFRPASIVAPPAGAVLLDTGPIGPNPVYVEMHVRASANANNATPQLIRRNALNSADLEVDQIAAGAGTFNNAGAGVAISMSPAASIPYEAESRARVTLAPGERLLIRNLNAAAALESWQASMDLWVQR